MTEFHHKISTTLFRALFLVFLIGYSFTKAQTTLSPGDIAFVAYQMDNPDRFAFVLLADISANTEIKFTDSGWNGSAFITTLNESTCTWISSSALTAGTVISIESSPTGPDAVANTGTTIGKLNGLNGTSNEIGDQIIAFQGVRTNPNFIAGISSRGWASNISSSTEDVSVLPNTLGLFVTAYGLEVDSHADNGFYWGCITTGNKAQLRRELNDPQNWGRSNSVVWPSAFPTYTVTQAAEPWPGTSLNVGDIAFVAYQTDDPERYAFVLLEDIVAGTRIRFTDEGWSGGRFYAGLNENSAIWTADSALSAGVVVAVDNGSVNYGSVCGRLNLLNNTANELGDNIFAYQGDIGNPRFLAGVATRQWTTSSNATTEDISRLPNSLSLLGTAFGHDLSFHVENGRYRGCITTGNKAQLRREINDPQNWVLSSNLVWPSSFPTYTVTQTAEPWPGTSLSIGDIAFVAYQTDDPERFAFVLLEDIVAGTRIRFTDEGWSGSRFYAGINENSTIWTADSALSAGVVVAVDNGSVNYGSMCGNLNLLNNTANELGDNILAYQGDIANPRFLAGVATRQWTTSSNASTEDISRLPNSLSLLGTAFGHDLSFHVENGRYRGCITTGNKAQLRREINDPQNWVLSSNLVWPSSFPTYTVTQAAEPWPGTSLSVGDIAFVAYQTDDPERFAFVLLEDVVAGTRIRFTDEGWSGSRFYTGINENSTVWTADSALSAGVVVAVDNGSVNYGSMCGNLNLLNNTANELGDNILAYQGDIGNPRFLAGVATRQWTTSSNASTEDISRLPNALSLLGTAFGHDLSFHVENGRYIGCITTGNKAQLRREINDPQNWVLSNSLVWPSSFPTYTVTQAAEPWPGTSLNAGDIAFVAYQTDDPERFAFVLLEDIVAGTRIRFTDEGWSGSRFYAGINETSTIWTADSALSAGIVIAVDNGSVNYGSLCGRLNLLNNTANELGDNILAYQGDIGNPRFLAGLATRQWTTSSNASTEDISRLPNSLSLLGTAFGHDLSFHVENGRYKGCIRTGDKAQLRREINDPQNWILSSSLVWPSTITNFNVTQNPAPWPGTLLSTGCISYFAYQTDDPERLAFVLLSDVVAGTRIRFTDEGWSGGRFYAGINENSATWIADSALSAGVVIAIDNGTANYGSMCGNLNLLNNTANELGDNIFAYQGYLTNPIFLTGLATRGWTNSSNASTEDISRLPNALSQGVNAIGFTSHLDNGIYNGSLAPGTNSQYTQRLNTPGNWTRSNSINWPSSFPVLDITSSVGCCVVAKPNFSFSIDCQTKLVSFRNTTPNTDLATTFRWDINGDNLIDTVTSGDFEFQYPASGMYEVKVIADRGGCMDSTVQTVSIGNVPQTPTISANGPIELCDGQSVTLSGPPGVSGYRWSNGSVNQSITVSTAGTFSLRVLGIDGCESLPASIQVRAGTSPSTPVISASGPLSFCEGDSVELFAPAGFPEYAWNTGETTQSIWVSNTGSFSVKVSNSAGCESPSATENVTVLETPPKPVISQVQDTLFANATGTSYEWYLGANIIPGQTSSFLIPTSGGSYTVIAINGTCPSDTSEKYAYTATGLIESTFEYLTISPNPSAGIFLVEGQQFDNKPLSISVWNSLGMQVVPKVELTPGIKFSEQIDLTNHPNGLYQLRILEGHRQMHVKLLVQR